MKTSQLLRVLRGLAGFALAASAASAADTSKSSSSSSDSNVAREAPRSYTDGGTTRVEVTTQYDPGWATHNYQGFSPYSGIYNSGTTTTTVRVPRTVVLLPPTPPPLGEPVRTTQNEASFSKVTLPPVLRSFFYESFYSPLSALMYAEELNRKRRETLDAYLAQRTQLVAALQAKLEALASAPAETRRAELQAFATTQAEPLARLEATAEDFRSNIVNGSWVEASVDWNELRSWRLGDNARWESAFDEVKVLSGASFFQDGLSLAQRQLLRELAMELTDSMRAPDEDIGLTTPGPFLYFSPFTARIRVPVGLPAELQAKLDDYRARKAALKRELRDELYKQDRAFWASTRTNALRALAAKQAPEFAALEALAEEIRVGLQPFPNPARPPELSLPPALTKRIATYFATKTAWQKAMVEKQNELRAQFSDDRVEFSRLSGRPSIAIVPNRRSKPEQDAKRATALAALELFNAEQGRLYDQLARDKEALRADIFQIASAAAGRQTAKPIDQILQEFSYSVGRQENWLRYADYEAAVLQPGLSIEQRRLLFGAALEKLGLPIANP